MPMPTLNQRLETSKHHSTQLSAMGMGMEMGMGMADGDGDEDGDGDGDGHLDK